MALGMTFGNPSTPATTLAGGASLTTNGTIDLSTKYEGQVTVSVTAGGAVSTTAGVQVDVYVGSGSGPSYSTQPVTTFVISVTSPGAVTTNPPVFLGPGKYQCKMTNLDATNAVTYTVAVTTVDSI